VTVALIVAMDETGIIGRAGDLPWHLPDDLRRFKSLTLGHVLLMGRRTLESIGRALPGRRSIVLTRDAQLVVPDGVTRAGTLDEALALAGNAPRVFVIGGAAVYDLALPRASELLVTRVHASVDGDVRFPTVDWSEWELLEEEYHAADARHAHAFTFQRYRRHTN
jgi:dihydrofolate reductase